MWRPFLVLLISSSYGGLEASPQCSWDPAEAVLECAVEWQNAEAGLAFARHQREATRTLRIICNEEDGDLSSEHKRLTVDYDGGRQNPWPHLQSLHVLHCPLASIGVVLDGLSLEQQGKDVLHDVIKPLLGGRALSGLRHLAILEAGLLDLSSGLWCEAGANLVSLNLSSNGLARVPTSINGSCQHSLQHLEVLNLADNAINSFKETSVLVGEALTHLDVSRNRLQTFQLPSKVNSLKFLDVSENKLASVASLFKAVSASSASLQELHAQGNQMDSLPNLSTAGGSVVNFDNLVVLNLSRNAIHHLEEGAVMHGLSTLVALDLSHNKLTHLDDHLLRDLPHLQVLSVAHNQIVELGRESLAKLTRLHVLVLSHNNLDDKGLSEGFVLRQMSDLRSLSLDHNRLKSLPSELFRGCSSLRDLSLAANFLRSWPKKALDVLGPHLHTLDMGENSLRQLEALGPFQQLYGLRLAGNRLRNLTFDTFDASPHIRMLNVADNLLEHIDLATFEPLKHLKALRLDNNRLEDINGLLTVQHQLQWLNVSHNHLQWFDYAIIPKSVIWLSLRHNRIEELGNYYNMQEGFHLRHLDIGHNNLMRMDRQALQPSLTEVYADHNAIAELGPNMFIGLRNLTRVNLTHNRLQTFPLSALTLSLDHGKCQLWLSPNPLACDCEMEWLQRINSLAAKSPREFPLVADWPQLSCWLNNRGDNKSLVEVSAVRPSEFLCSYETHCFALCMCCDFFACDCRMKCSDGCNCFHDQTWSSNIIECGNRGHTKVPEFIPMDATSVYLDGNQLSQDALLNDEFIGRKHLTALYLNNSQITVISNQTLKGLSELLVLHLEDNALASLPTGQEFDELISLRELYLHNNKLEFIHPHTLSPLVASLQILSLRNNRLKEFHLWDYIGPQLHWLSLGGTNTWTCQCDVMQKFSAALKTHPGLKVVDLEDIKCLNKENNSSCADVLAVSFRSGETFSWDNLVPVLAVTVASTIIVISLIILAVAARKPIRSWFQRRYDGIQRSNIYGIVNRAGQGPSHKYDILALSNSPQDEDFVNATLIPALEAQSYKVAGHNNLHANAILEQSGGVCVVLASSSSSYIQNNPQDLLTLSKLCRDGSRPLVLVALDSSAVKCLRRLPDLRMIKILLWEAKSFWPTWHSVFPLKQGTAVKSSNENEDLWTYLKGPNCNGSAGGESSLSTQSTGGEDTMTKVMATSARRFSTQRTTSSQQRPQFNMASSSTLQVRRLRQPHVIENPMTHHRSNVPDEPIYHSLDDDMTVYINADLEVVYPSPSPPLLMQPASNSRRYIDEEEDNEAELNGLLADCYEENLGSYVPSPAPGSFPRHHLSYAAANSDNVASSSSKRRGGYLV